MRLTLTRRWKHTETKSVFGTLIGPSVQFLTCEREWRNNLPNVSCVPTGFYMLQPHNGDKYKKTFALIGETVAHHVGAKRTACVFHRAVNGSRLEGCIALAESCSMFADETAGLAGLDAGKEWLAELRAADAGPIYLTIHEEF